MLSIRTIPVPEVLSILFARERPAFTHEVESYKHWAFLGALSGCFHFVLGRDGEEELCEPGEFLICPPGVDLRRRALGKLGFCFIQFRWKAAMSNEWQGKHSFMDLVRLESTLGHLEKIRPHPTPGRERLWADHLLLDLFQQRRHELGGVKARGQRVEDRQMIQVAEKMRKELSGPLQLNEMAVELRLTPTQFSRRFKTAFGTNPALYRTQLRMQEARRLLLETAMSLTQIAEACGYENAFYFSRVFRERNGKAPSRFRKSLRV